jgi:hypothetical protein
LCVDPDHAAAKTTRSAIEHEQAPGAVGDNVLRVIEQETLQTVVAAHDALLPGIQVDEPDFAGIGSLDLAWLIGDVQRVAGAPGNTDGNAEAAAAAVAYELLGARVGIDTDDGVERAGSVSFVSDIKIAVQVEDNVRPAVFVFR